MREEARAKDPAFYAKMDAARKDSWLAVARAG